MDLKGQDWLYLALGAGAVWLIVTNTKPLSKAVTSVVPVIDTASKIVTNAGSVINPLLGAAGKGAEIVTDPASWIPQKGSFWDLMGKTATGTFGEITKVIGGWI